MNKSDIPNAKASKADEVLRQWCVEQANVLAPFVMGSGQVIQPEQFVRLASKIEDYVRGRITTP